MKLVSVPQMVAIEKDADAAGLSYPQMMENAGRGLAESVLDLDSGSEDGMILGLVGPGNNGGDTLIALATLASSGRSVQAYLVKRQRDELCSRIEKAGGEVLELENDLTLDNLDTSLHAAAVVLDGILGTGSKPPVRPEVARVMARVNEVLTDVDAPPFVIAVDCPSGVDCDSGAADDESIPADLTLTMAAVKQGLMKLPAYELVGDLRVVDIGLPADLPSIRSVTADVAEENLVASILPTRSPTAHKGTFGTALIAAGSLNYTGAAYLAAASAYRIGAGLVTLAVPQPLHSALAGRIPEATWILLPHELGVISRDATDVLLVALQSSSAALVGPGLGLEKTTEDFFEAILTSSRSRVRASSPMGFAPGAGRQQDLSIGLPPLVIDADGLKLLSRVKDWPRRLPDMTVLTPHPGEMAVLSGLSTGEVQTDRSAVAQRFAREWGHIVVLKGAFTVVASPQGNTCLIPVASAALARAGTGDVLAGLIVGLRAQGVTPYEAAIAGAWIHAQAGLHAARRLGNSASVLAGDVLDSVASVISDLPRV